MSYFDNFGTMLYANMANPNAVMEGDFKTVRNIFERVGLVSDIVNNVSLYYNYYVTDTDTPEIIASKYYNDPTRHWIILFANLIIDPYWQWPKNTFVFEEYLIQKYGSVANAQSMLHNYDLIEYRTITLNYQANTSNTTTYVSPGVLSVDGHTTFPTIDNPTVLIQGNTTVRFPDSSVVDISKQLVFLSAYDYENNLNEAARNIKIIRNDYVEQIEQQMNILLSM